MADLPPHAPSWAAPLVTRLVDAGFSTAHEEQGGMQAYALRLGRADCTVEISGDRGELFTRLLFPQPRRGRGRPVVVTVWAADYLAGVRGDTGVDFLLSPDRDAEAARWLGERVSQPEPLALDEDLLARIQALQRRRAQAMFG